VGVVRPRLPPTTKGEEVNDDADELLALQKAAASIDVSLDGASPRQIAVLKRSSTYQWILFDLKCRRLGREILAALPAPIRRRLTGTPVVSDPGDDPAT
jgi:hypothetical protein